MKLENQVVSLKYAKKLKELGFKQESLWYWGITGWTKKKDTWEIIYHKEQKNVISIISAYTVAELGEMLKKYDIDYWYSYPDFRLKLAESHTSDGRDEKEANARAEMLIYLKENKLI